MGKKFGGHPLTINNDTSNEEAIRLLLVSSHDGRKPTDQMLIPTVGGSQQWMPAFVLLQDECSTSQNRTQAPH
jgi:hypothetical protein